MANPLAGSPSAGRLAGTHDEDVENDDDDDDGDDDGDDDDEC